jgi:hypothetical protein
MRRTGFMERGGGDGKSSFLENVLDKVPEAADLFDVPEQQGQMQVAERLIRFARKSRREKLRAIQAKVRYQLLVRGWKYPHIGNDRTAYVIGLFGTGRSYVSELLVHNIGERGNYFRDNICCHPGPTSMIYSGHATMKYVSRLQDLPQQTRGLVEAVKAGFADLIFVYRHPLDSLLTNWVWWRTYLRDQTMINGISQVYQNTDSLCADLERNFLEFKAFADGDPAFFAALPGLPFLSFPEFVEETELHLQSATLALRLEDFMIDPLKEFSKIAEVMSVELDVRRVRIVPPRTRAYGYLAVKDKVPRFRSFIDGLDTETRRRIEKAGYSVTG